MRALFKSAIVAGLGVLNPGDGAHAAITVLKTNGTAVPVSAYTKTFDPFSGGWTITLTTLYAPGLDSVFEIHGDAGEVIDTLAITADGPRAGSPLIARIISDPPGGISSVSNIVQTGSAETILNKVQVYQDIGSVTVLAIGDLIAGRDVIGPITAFTGDNATRGITSVQAARHILGDVTADNGRVMLVWAQNGNIGANGTPITIRAKFAVWQVMGQDVYANINTRYNGGTGGFWALVANKFIGTLTTEKLFLNTFNNVDGLILITQQFSGLIMIGKSFNTPTQYIELPLNGLTGQIVVNADNAPGGTWTAPVRLGPQGNPNQVVLTGPSYSQLSSTLGGGSVGLVPFRLHNQACTPANGQTVLAATPVTVRLRHFGPVVWTALPLTIDRRPAGSANPYTTAPMSDFSISPVVGDANSVQVTRAPGKPGFAAGYQYRIRPTTQLRSSVPSLPGVQWDQDYIVTVNTAQCLGDINNSGVVNVDDLLLIINYWGRVSPLFPAADITGNGMVNVDDLLVVINHWGPCS